MDSQRPNPATEIVETPARTSARRVDPSQPPRPHGFRRKIDCDGSSGVTEQRPQVRGARSPNREQRFVY